MTAFKEILGACGLSHNDAANYFDTSIDSIKSWCSGRRSVPDGVWNELHELFHKVQDAISIMDRHNNRYEFDTELEANDIRDEFSNYGLPDDMPDGALRRAFHVAKIVAPNPSFIEKM
ncbi:MAG: hypothetical protein NXI02_24970 [Rhodobacteraceae bacterium]|nr:hypothetical protein [Paracoccaceae bacterium]